MKKSFKTYHTNITFFDLLFNTVLGFTFFFAICLILMNIQKAKTDPNIKTKAEFVITLTWDSNAEGLGDDIDLWIEDPEDNIIFFKNKELGLSHLDRDDLGNTNDSIITADGRKISIPINQEIGTIRGIIPGEWTVNIHMYRKRIKEPSNVEVKIEKLNPTVKIVAYEKYLMKTDLEEITVARFMVSNDGTVLFIDKIPKKLIEKKLEHSEMTRGGRNEL